MKKALRKAALKVLRDKSRSKRAKVARGEDLSQRAPEKGS